MTDTTEVAAVDTQAPAAPVSIEVPAEHADLITRAVALLKKGEQWIADNIHAGITTLEDMAHQSTNEADALEEVAKDEVEKL